MWTSLGLKFVVQIAQLIDRAFAVSVAGANVKAREITTGESSGYSIKKKRTAKRFSFLWTSLGLNQGPPDYETNIMIFRDSL